MQRGDMTNSEVFLEEEGIHVSSSKIVIDAQTFVTNAVTSVKVVDLEEGGGRMQFGFYVALFGLASMLVGILMEGKASSFDEHFFRFIFATIGVAFYASAPYSGYLIGFGTMVFLWGLFAGKKVLVLGTMDGQSSEFIFKDEKKTNKVASAVQQAMFSRPESNLQID